MQRITAKVILSDRIKRLDPALIRCARDWVDESQHFRPGHRMGTFCLDRFEWCWAIHDRLVDDMPERVIHISLERENWESAMYDQLGDTRFAYWIVGKLSYVRNAFRSLTVRGHC